MRNTAILAVLLVTGGLLAATHSANAAAYTFTQIDAPQFEIGFGTNLNDINNKGQIVGTSDHGFLYTDGNFIRIDAPDAATTVFPSTRPSGINDAGQIVGIFDNGASSNFLHGFLDTGGIFTTLDVSGALATFPSKINNAGQIVGYFESPPVGGMVSVHGFLYANGSFAQIDVPGASRTIASGINNAGQIVGTFFDETGTHGFIDTDGSFTTFDLPAMAAGTPGPSDINDAEQIVGSFSSFFGPPPFLHGFLYDNGSFTIIDVPPTTFGTEANGINDAGQIVGTFRTNGNHGYLATPASAVPEPSSLALAGSSGLFGLGVFYFRRRRARR